MSNFGPPVPSHGPVPSRIVLLAEAPGTEESQRGRPLVGPAGYELRRMLNTVGVNLDDCRKINVFSRQPNGNILHLYCNDDPSQQYRALGPLASNPTAYMDVAHLGELERCYEEISACNPNIIISLGNTAAWALGLGTGISGLRGSVHQVTIPTVHRPLKVLPTYHPASVLRQWDQRVVAIADLEKAVNEADSPDFSFDNTELWLNPSLDDLVEFDVCHMQPATVCACDIETKRGQITAISFAPFPDISLAIPFWIEGPAPNYWESDTEEAQAWRYVRRWLERPDLVKVFQNGLYDLQYLTAPPLSIRPRNCTEDTMLAHHSLYSEMQKGLGFLGSIYANVPSWKGMRTFKKEEQLKRDD